VLALFILAPLIGLIVLNLPLGKASARLAVAVGLVLSLAQVIAAAWHPAELFAAPGMLSGLFSFALAYDNLSLVMLLIIGVIAAIAIMIAAASLKEPRSLFHFANLLLVAMIGMNGLALVSDLFSLYVFLEITSVASFILIALNRTGPGLEGAFKYVIMSAVAGVMMIGAIALLLLTTGSTSFSVVAAAFKANSSHDFYTKLAMGLFVCGLFIKGGLVPFHGWVLGAYSAAPTATSVLLAGIASKISGIYILIRLVVSVFGFDPGVNQVLLFVGALSAVVGALAALGQTDFKRLLAYSSISQMGYILLGLGCGSELGLLGAVFHFFNHAMFKSQLFVNAAALEDQLGTTDMNKMGGLGARMPWTSTTSILAALSTAGVPPLSGFWSKLIIIIALWQANSMGYSMLAVAVSVLTLAYMLMMQRKVFFGHLDESLKTVREARFGLVAPAVILAAITVGVGVAIPFLAFVLDLFKQISGGFFPHV
jgi:multicomponent Na+:H+ antiporter subunit D